MEGDKKDKTSSDKGTSWK